MSWFASRLNRWAETNSEPAALPFYYVMSDAGLMLERDDGELRKFIKPETAIRAAEKLNKECGYA